MELQADLRKVFESVHQPTLIERAFALGYPMCWFRFAVASYIWPRMLEYKDRVRRVTSEELAAGILAGAGVATRKPYLAHPIEQALQRAYTSRVPWLHSC